VVLDERRVEIERDLLAARKQRPDTREEMIKRPVQLADMAEREASQEAPERARLGQAVAAQRRLRLIRTQKANILQALAAGDHRLAEGEDRLPRHIAALAPLDRDRVKQHTDTEPIEARHKR
jgi:uncharacterized tellurite resistance protein B-like protein